MKLSSKGLALLKGEEGCRLTAYWDGTGECWTVGYGHTGPSVHAGMQCTQDEVDWFLLQDTDWAARAVNELVRAPISQPMFDALVSLVFNIGRTAFEDSTLLRKLNLKDYIGASAEFPKWKLSGGKPILYGRRMREKAMFDGGIDEIVAA